MHFNSAHVVLDVLRRLCWNDVDKRQLSLRFLRTESITTTVTVRAPAYLRCARSRVMWASLPVTHSVHTGQVRMLNTLHNNDTQLILSRNMSEWRKCLYLDIYVYVSYRTRDKCAWHPSPPDTASCKQVSPDETTLNTFVSLTRYLQNSRYCFYAIVIDVVISDVETVNELIRRALIDRRAYVTLFGLLRIKNKESLDVQLTLIAANKHCSSF